MANWIRPILSYESEVFKSFTYISQQNNGSTMFHLILVIANIALSLAFLQATMSYSPWWNKSASDTELIVKGVAPKLEQAYIVTTRLGNGDAPAVDTELRDGGLWNSFGAVLGLPVAAPTGFEWVYGQHGEDDSIYSGMHYFCLKSTAPISDGVYRGVLRAKAIYGADQAFFSSHCGATTEAMRTSRTPNSGALTIFVTYVPGLVQ